MSKLKIISRMDLAMCQIYERKLKQGLNVRTMNLPHQQEGCKLGMSTITVTGPWKQNLRQSFVNDRAVNGEPVHGRSKKKDQTVLP